MKDLNKIYCGDSLKLIKELEVEPQLCILSPPDINETDFTLNQYKEFVHSIYSDCAKKLKDGGVLFSCTTDTKRNGSIYTKHTDIINSVSDQLNLFNYKIWAKSLKTNLFILNYCHMTFFCKGKRSSIKNKVPEFLPDVWVLERDKVDNYPSKDSFPSELVKRVVLTFTNENDLVLDPFIGCGKTGKVVLENKRNFIGFEIEPKFVELAEKYIGLK
jgi:DNA modification methylase